jgi:hypothetical protein
MCGPLRRTSTLVDLVSPLTGSRDSGFDDSGLSTCHDHTHDASGEPSPDDHEGQG